MLVRKEVSKDNILELITAYDIFKHYISEFQEVNRLFRSDLRQDKNPTCSVYLSGNKFYYKDFAEGSRLDCFDYVQLKYSLTFVQALNMIAIDFNLNLVPTIKLNHESTQAKTYDISNMDFERPLVFIDVYPRSWNLQDKAYWNKKYGFTSKELNKAKIMPIKAYSVNGIYRAVSGLTYAFDLGVENETGRGLWKIYSPFSIDKKKKWRTNAPDTCLQGWHLLPKFGEFLIITKSLKDLVVLNKLGIPAVAPQAESVSISEKLFAELQKRFKNIVLLYDNDAPGIKASIKRCAEMQIPCFYMPNIAKDASDFVEIQGYEVLSSYIGNYLSICLQSLSLDGNIIL